jgi:hypothetical protein
LGKTFSPPETIVAALHDQPAALVEAAHVAGRHQAVDDVLAAATGVALELGAVADEDPPRFALRQLLAVLVEDLHDRRERRLARRTRRLAEVRRRRDGRVGDLGRAVDVVEVLPELVHPVVAEVARQRGPGGRNDLHPGQVVVVLRLLVELHDPLQHHRDHDQRVALLLGEGLQAALGVELAAQHDGRAEQHGQREVRPAPGVEQRRGDVAAPPRLQRQPREEGGRRLDARLAAGCALGGAGGAGGEDDDPARLVRRLVVAR